MCSIFNGLIASIGKAYRETLIIVLSWFLLLDSIIYGLTKIFKRNLLNSKWKSPNFDTTEETLKASREEGILRPQFYLDKKGESDINIFVK